MRSARAARVGAILAAAGMVSVLGAANAVARTDQPYCAVSRGFEIVYQDCSYATFAACLEEIRGLGGHCQSNGHYVRPPSDRRYPDRRHPRPPR